MTSCFRAKNTSVKLPSSYDENVYPPLIKIQRSLVIPGFINECRELSRALSLDIYSFDDTVSETSTEPSLLSKITSRADILDNFGQGYEQGYIGDNFTPTSNGEKTIQSYYSIQTNGRNIIGKFNDNFYNESKPNNTFLYKQKSKIVNKTKKRVFSLPTNNENNIGSQFFPSNPPSTKPKNEVITTKIPGVHALNSKINNEFDNSADYVEKEVKVQKNNNIDSSDEKNHNSYINHNYNFNGNTKSVSYSNPRNQFKVNKKPSNLVTQPTLPKLDSKNNKLDDSSPSSIPDAHVESDKNSNEPTAFNNNSVGNRISTSVNSETNQLNNEKSHNNTRNVSNHRSSLRILAQSVINLMNKRGSRGRNEKPEVKSILTLMDINGLLHTPLSGSKLENQSEDETESEYEPEFEPDNNQPSYKTVSSYLSANVDECDPNNISNNDINNNNINARQSLIDGINIKLDIKPSTIKKSPSTGKDDYKTKIDQPNLKTRDNYNYMLNAQTGIDDFGINSNINNIDSIQSFHLSRSFSSESILSNYSHEQRVARTYDMQILTYDQSAIPIPNLPRGQLKVIEDLDNCFIILSPKLSNIFSCYC
ncbi:hypothetical protein FG379_000150 [Cryptosporidium bovis]|uniref:uncharacterized protein n=1 Tax=Cryptosporidium bovis TaxID=310047 RepID=UPI00351A37A1|nr:hypothetical protein FG379_000150 [Cryptosporidium bovis]